MNPFMVSAARIGELLKALSVEKGHSEAGQLRYRELRPEEWETLGCIMLGAAMKAGYRIAPTIEDTTQLFLLDGTVNEDEE